MGFGRKLHRRMHSEWKEGYICYRIAKMYLTAYKLARRQLVKLAESDSNSAQNHLRVVALNESYDIQGPSSLIIQGFRFSERQIRALSHLCKFEESFYMFFSNEAIKIELFLEVHVKEVKQNLFLVKWNILFTNLKSTKIKNQFKYIIRDFY